MLYHIIWLYINPNNLLWSWQPSRLVLTVERTWRCLAMNGGWAARSVPVGRHGASGCIDAQRKRWMKRQLTVNVVDSAPQLPSSSLLFSAVQRRPRSRSLCGQPRQIVVFFKWHFMVFLARPAPFVRISTNWYLNWHNFCGSLYCYVME